jgi:DNA-binding transcriptional regulator YbjK
MRTATLHLATQDWSKAYKILPSEVDEARRILNQLAAILEEMKPKVLTAGDMQDAMEKLLASSGKSPAEKLEELSNLRYQRLLTDQEFLAAKMKILEI